MITLELKRPNFYLKPFMECLDIIYSELTDNQKYQKLKETNKILAAITQFLVDYYLLKSNGLSLITSYRCVYLLNQIII